MSQVAPLGFQKIVCNILTLKQELKEKKNDLKLDPSLYIQFLKRLGHCEFQFHQLQDTCIASHQASKLVQRQLNSIHNKLIQYTPQKIIAENLKKNSDPQNLLIEIIDQFKHHQSQDAMESFSEFEKLFPQIAKQIFENLWRLKGSPRNSNRNLHRDLFYGTEGFTVLDIEKAEAVQCCFSSPKQRLQQIQQLFEQNKEGEALGGVYKSFYSFGDVKASGLNDCEASCINSIQLASQSFNRESFHVSPNCKNFYKRPLALFAEFSRIYPKIADCIYGKVWEVYDCPTDRKHAQIAHPHFGSVAFHNQHPKPEFQIQWKKNGEAIGLVLQDWQKLLDSEQSFAEQNIQRLDRRCVDVANETVHLFKQGEYVTSNGQKHPLAQYLKFMSEQSRMYKDAGAPISRQPRFTHTEFEVRSQNCVQMAYELNLNGNNTLVLNLGNSHHFGGDYLKARGTQEEELCRCTGLAPALDRLHGIQKQDFYPIHHKAGPAGGIYTPQVPIIRMGMKHDYSFYEQPQMIAVATFASYNQPPLDYSNASNPRLQGEELKWTREKIRTIYQMAYENGHDTLVLGAMGCGAFSNPPRHIAELFLDVYDKEFKGCFKYVGFAVIEDMNYGKKHNPEGNFKPFARLVQQNGGKAYNSKGEILFNMD
jgi:uncharacterized protein (TIGR02452 family)